MSSISDDIISSYKNYESLEQLAHDHGVCIEITSGVVPLYSTNQYSKGCFVEGTDKYTYKTAFISSNKNLKTYKLINERYGNESLISAIKLDNNFYAFVSTLL